MNRRIAWCVVVAAALTLPTGCRFGTGSTSDVRREVTRQTGVELAPEFGIKLGRVSVALAKPIVKLATKHGVPMNGVAKVEIGVYRLVAPFAPEAVSMESVELPDWQPILRVREGTEDVRILVQAEGERVHAMLVLALDGEDFVVVRLRGKLHRVIPRILEIAGGDGMASGFEASG